MLAVNLELGLREVLSQWPGSGGLPVLRALRGPFPTMRFMPTGGITRASMPDYLAFAPVLAVGGTWMVRHEWLVGDRFDIIADACARDGHGSRCDVRRGKVKACRSRAGLLGCLASSEPNAPARLPVLGLASFQTTCGTAELEFCATSASTPTWDWRATGIATNRKLRAQAGCAGDVGAHAVSSPLMPLPRHVRTPLRRRSLRKDPHGPL